MLRFFAVAALSLLPAVAGPAIPDTPAGRVLRAWLDAFNTGEKARIESYLQVHEPGKSSDQMMQFREQTGGFELLGVESSERNRIEFRVKEAASPTEASGSIVVSDAEPPVVTEFKLRARAPGEAAAAASPIDAPTRTRVIDGALINLKEFYVFPETAAKMEQAIRERQKKGEYDAVTDGDKFATLLTDHLREVSHDRHLGVRYSPAVLPQGEPDAGPEEQAKFRKQLERMNCGFQKLEILSRNIGYVKFNMFADPDICGPTAIAAMNFLGSADAIIFDLRENGGGEPKMIALISSYLFDEPTHLNDLYNRKEDSTTQYWTSPYIPGKKLAKKPVFVLTSKRTFSGAEEFSYNLKNLKRATLIGETTGGGAHPVSGHRIDDHFMIGVPFARAVNPISKTNWEGTGVEPDVKAPGGEALDVAKKMAWERLAKQPLEP